VAVAVLEPYEDLEENMDGMDGSKAGSGEIEIRMKREDALNVLEVLWRAMIVNCSAPAVGPSAEERAYAAMKAALKFSGHEPGTPTR
jgi:hypothetical protein